MQKESKRLYILAEHEIDQIYSIPNFNLNEKNEHFSLNIQEKNIAYWHKSPDSIIYFILQLGYFKAKKQFFSFSFQDVSSDTKYIIYHYFKAKKTFPYRDIIPKATHSIQQKKIIALFGYQKCTNVIKNNLLIKAKQLIFIDTNPLYIFKELMIYLENNKIIPPGYTFMQDIIGKVITEEKKHLIKIAKEKIPEKIKESLINLISDNNKFLKITYLKKIPKDFSQKEIKKEINKQQSIYRLYFFSKDFLKELNISNETIKYYAYLVGNYNIYQMKQLNYYLVQIFLLCFINNRFQNINDNLIESFLSKVRKYLANIIKELSPVAWQHINLYGRYEFNRKSSKVDINKIIADLMIRTT